MTRDALARQINIFLGMKLLHQKGTDLGCAISAREVSGKVELPVLSVFRTSQHALQLQKEARPVVIHGSGEGFESGEPAKGSQRRRRPVRPAGPRSAIAPGVGRLNEASGNAGVETDALFTAMKSSR